MAKGISTGGVDQANAILHAVEEENSQPPEIARRLDSPAAPVPKPVAMESTAAHPGWHWTWRLLSAGFNVEECCQIRRMPREAVLAEALEAVENRCRIDANWLFSAAEIQRLQSASSCGEINFGEDGASPADAFSRVELQLFLKCQSGNREKWPANSP